MKLIFNLLRCVVIAGLSQCSLLHAEPLEVGADISLKGVLKELAESFPGNTSNIQVRLNLAPSGILREKIEEGKESFDIFIGTSQSEIAALSKIKKVYDATTIRLAENHVVLVSVWPVKTEKNWLELAETQWKRMVLANPQTTMSGVVAQNLLGAEGFLENWSGQIIYESSSEKVLEWVKRARADAGVLYYSDTVQLRPLETFHVFEIDAMRAFPIIYYGVVLSTARDVKESEYFLKFIADEAQDAIWQRWGFNPKN